MVGFLISVLAYWGQWTQIWRSLNVGCPLCASYRINALQWIWGILPMPNWDVSHHLKWRLKKCFWIVAAWDVFLEASSISLGLSSLSWSQKKHLSPLLIEMTCPYLNMQRKLSLQITVEHSKSRHITLLWPTHCWVILDPHKVPQDLSHPTPLGVSLKVIWLHALNCGNAERSFGNMESWHCGGLLITVQFPLPGKDKAYIWMILMLYTLCWAQAYPPCRC